MPKDITIVPYARNGLPADFLFTQRKYYAESDLIYPLNGIPKPVDMWVEKPLWGKVDTKGRYVYPDIDSLKTINNNIEVINFVADAYFDMLSFVLNASRSLKTCMTSIIDVTEPVKGHHDLVSDYNTYFNESLEPAFVDTFLSQKERDKIKSFKDYAGQYIAFVEKNSIFPHTLAAYLSSVNCSNRTSGLMIEFSTVYKYDDDQFKWTEFISSDFFVDYIRIAGLHGFYVNKNIPWSIAANMNSIYMKERMALYDINNDEENFNVNYIQAEFISYESFKKYMFYAYYSLITFQPKVEKLSIENCIASKIFDSRFKTKIQKVTRSTEFENVNTATYDDFLDIYPESYFIEIYLHIRLIEEKIILSTKERLNLVQKIVKKIQKSDVFDGMLFFADFLAKKRVNSNLRLTSKRMSDSMTSSSNTGASQGAIITSGY